MRQYRLFVLICLFLCQIIVFDTQITFVEASFSGSGSYSNRKTVVDLNVEKVNEDSILENVVLCCQADLVV